MMEMIEANWPLLLVAFLIGLAIAWFLFNANRRTKVTGSGATSSTKAPRPPRAIRR